MALQTAERNSGNRAIAVSKSVKWYVCFGDCLTVYILNV